MTSYWRPAPRKCACDHSMSFELSKVLKTPILTKDSLENVLGFSKLLPKVPFNVKLQKVYQLNFLCDVKLQRGNDHNFVQFHDLNIQPFQY